MLKTAIRLARAAGHILRRATLVTLNVSHKGRRDLVTNADIAAQRAIVNALRASFPDHAILAEEEGLDHAATAEWTWIIDPLDGTTNYAHGVPNFCVSIALQHRGEPYLGVVYDPLRDHLFYAQRGEGAWLNGRRLHVSQAQSLDEALVGYDWARSDDRRRLLVMMIDRLSRQAIAVRSVGAAALGLCYVAAGWYDAYFNFELRIWDIAAAALLIEEAGGRVHPPEEKPIDVHIRGCLAANKALYPSFRQVYTDIIAEVSGGPSLAQT